MPLSIIEELMHTQNIPGLSILIQRGESILENDSYGIANLEHHVPVTASTIFEIASITKLLTAQAILYLIQTGKLRLEHTLGDYLDTIPDTWKAVTVRHCLTHQSGIPSYTNNDTYWQQTRRDKTHDEVLDLIRHLPMKFEPGQRHAYDNTGFYLLGLIIEAISGQEYGTFLQNTIFDPLNMKHTKVNNYSEIIPHRAQGYNYQDNILRNKDFYSVSNTYSAGNLLSNSQDLLKWTASLHDNTILNQDWRTQWWTPHPSKDGRA